MELIIARHGNTFSKGDKIVWVGRNEDLPLTLEGEAQAAGVAQELQGVSLAAVYCAPLHRTRRFAEIITNLLGIPAPITEKRLTEIDYGVWGGKSDGEIIAAGGEGALKGWKEEGIWPEVGVWGSLKEEIRAAIHSFAKELTMNYGVDDKVLIVSSNGCIRFFLELLDVIPEEIALNHGKVKTGHLCSLSFNETDHSYTLNYWNKACAAEVLK